MVSTQLSECGKFVVYLNALTWRNGDVTAAFAEEVRTAMDAAVPVSAEMDGAAASDRLRDNMADPTTDQPGDPVPGDTKAEMDGASSIILHTCAHELMRSRERHR